MRHAIWKLAALGSVVGIGLLVVVQAQRNMPKSGTVDTAEQQASAPNADVPEPEPTVANQAEPGLGPEDFSDQDAVPAAVKTGTKRASTPPSRTRVADKSLSLDPFDMEEATPDEQSPRGTSGTGGAVSPRVNIADLDDSSDPFGDSVPPAKPAEKKAAPGRVMLTLNGETTADDSDAGPRLSAGDAKEEESSTGPRLLASNDDAPRAKAEKSKSADPLGEEDAQIPAPRANSRSAAIDASPRLSMDEEDPFGNAGDKKPARPARSATSPRSSLMEDDKADNAPLNASKPNPAAKRPAAPSTLPDDDIGAEPADKSPARTTKSAAPRSATPPTLLEDDIGTDSAARKPTRATNPGASRATADSADPFSDDGPAKLPAARDRTAQPVTEEAPGKSIDDDAFPKSKPGSAEQRENRETVPADDVMPRRGADSNDIPPRISDDGDAPLTGQPLRGAQPGSSRPAPSTADPFGDDEKTDAKPGSTRPLPSLSDDEPAPKKADEPDNFPRGTGRPAAKPEVDSEPAVPAPRSDPTPPATPAEDDGESIRRPTADETTPVKPAPQRVQSPQVSIDKVAPESAHLNQEMIYNILVRNVGTTPAHQVTVEDTIPRGVKLIGSIPRAMSDGNRLIWKLGTLEPGETRKIAVKIVPQSEGVIGTVATVNFATEVGARTTIAAPKLKLELDAPRQVTVGAPVVLNFRISNVGRIDATGVILREVLPAALRHPEGDDLEYEIGALPAGRSREVKLTLTAAQAGRAVNRAVVTADGNLSEESELQLDVVGPSLGVSRAGPKKLYLNKTGTFTNTVTNPGSTAAAELTLVETVPAGLEFVSATEGGEFNAAKRQIVWNISRLQPGESKKVQATLSANGRGAQVSVIRAYDGGGASGESVATINVTGFAALSIDVSEIPSVIEVGEGVTLQVRVRNRGSDVATNVRATIVVPNGMQVVSAKGPGRHREANVATPVGDAASRTFRNQHEIQFDPIANIDPRDEVTFDLTLQARSAGSGRLQLLVQSDKIAEPIRREELMHVVTTQE